MIWQQLHPPKTLPPTPSVLISNIKPISPPIYLRSPSSFSSSSSCRFQVQSRSNLAVGDYRPPSASQLTRSIKSEAEEVLFDYLHHTRNLPFPVALHISTNCPRLLHSLLLRIGDDSFSKYLRYHPINEFEAFLESLGLNPPLISLLLPPNVIFLNDDRTLLDNYQALRTYGFPHGSIGRIYSEASQVFGYDYGLVYTKLWGYEDLGLTKSCVVKLVSCCPLLLVGGISLDFLGVFHRFKGLGIWESFIQGCCPNQSKCDWKRIRDMLEFLDKVGFSEKQVKSLFELNPGLVFQSTGMKKILVLVGNLLKLGIQEDLISQLCIDNPQLLSRRFAKNLLQALRFLSDLGMESGDVCFIVCSHIQLVGSHSYKQPKTVLSRLQIGRNKLCRMIKEDPMKLFSLAAKSDDQERIELSCHAPIRHQQKVAFLMRLGYTENSDEMAKALKRFRGRGDQLQERFDCLVEAGLDSRVVTDMIKQVPTILNQTKDVIRKKIDCLRNYLGYELESVAEFPSYLCYDLDRINLRFSMYSWLRVNCTAAKSALSLGTILACSESRFVKYFVDVHPQGRGFWEALKHDAA